MHVEDGPKMKIQHFEISFSDPTILDDWKVKMLIFHFGSIFNMHYIVGFLSYKHDSKNKNNQQTSIISNLIIFLARAHFRARVHFIKLLQKWHFFTFSKHTATCLEISARASARQSMRMQKLNLFYIYIVLITSKLTLLWPCKVSRKFSKTAPPPALLNHLEHSTNCLWKSGCQGRKFEFEKILGKSL